MSTRNTAAPHAVAAENISKIYAESFRSAAHIEALVSEAQALVDTAASDRA